MPFSMTYGTEAVILVEVSYIVKLKGYRLYAGHNDECMIRNLEALEERRDMASVWLANYQQKLAQGYNKKVRPRDFVLEDLILQKSVGSIKDQNAGKLALN